MSQEGEHAREPGTVFQETVDELGRQARDDQRRGDIDEQHVLQHVGPEQEAFAELVQGRPDRDIADQDAEMEADGMPDGILRPARQPAGAVRPAGQGVRPGRADDQEQQEEFVFQGIAARFGQRVQTVAVEAHDEETETVSGQQHEGEVALAREKEAKGEPNQQ